MFFFRNQSFCVFWFELHNLGGIYSFSDGSTIDQKISNVVVIEGNNVTIKCNATGNPPPNITWIKDISPLVFYQGESYDIVNIDRNSAGDYTCTAWNGVGEKANATAAVTVHCKLFFPYNA